MMNAMSAPAMAMYPPFSGVFLPKESDDKEAQHRDEGYEPSVFYQHAYHLMDVRPSSSSSVVFLILYALSRMAIPTATSAAATVIVTMTNA